VGYHFEVFGFGKKITKAELYQYVEACQKWPMDLNKPLWKLVHIPELDDGTSAIVFVVHHAIGDGVSLVDVLLSLVDSPETLRKDSTVSKRAKPPKIGMGLRARAFIRGVTDGLTITMKGPDRLNPMKFKGVCGIDKTIASSNDAIELSQVKEICRKMADQFVSVNDVLMAVFTKTIAMYMKEQCQIDPSKLKLRAQFPMNMRKPGKPVRNAHGDPHNFFAYGLFNLPMRSHGDAKNLIMAIKREVDMIKHSPAPAIALSGLPLQMKMMPVGLLLDIVENVNNLGTFTISNVPGPQHEVFLAGSSVQVSV